MEVAGPKLGSSAVEHSCIKFKTNNVIFRPTDYTFILSIHKQCTYRIARNVGGVKFCEFH